MDHQDSRDNLISGWWVQGDAPVRTGCVVEPLIDGQATMLAMCKAFLAAKEYILLAGWDICVELPMVRGDDTRALGDVATEDLGTEAILRAEGFNEETIALWTANKLQVIEVLGYAVQHGVKVGVLLWDAFHMGSHVTNDPVEQQKLLQAVGVDCLLDDSSRQVTHVTQSLHQKCCVVDGKIAFVGGIDLTVQDSGDYDRWDTHSHLCSMPERASSRSAAAHPWHDVHSRIQGPAVADVLHNLVQRWTAVAERHNASRDSTVIDVLRNVVTRGPSVGKGHDVPNWPAELPVTTPGPLDGGVPAQIVRTIPPHTYEFAPEGIATIRAAYVQAFSQARRFIYLENQYLWPEIFIGLDRLAWGEKSPQSMEVINAIGDALARGVEVAITLPDHPNCGRQFTDGGIQLLRSRASESGDPERLRVFTLGSSESDSNAPGGIFYRPVYTHGKVAIVDDLWWTVGSANLNSRGMYSDAEINVSVLDSAGARSLRQRLWAEHLQRKVEDMPALETSASMFAGLQALARENQDHLEKRAPLDGHILPYLTAVDGKQLGLPVHPEHGWLDNLPGGAGALPDERAGRYL
jgi:phosphatidylserine/phosphatidylglycerophosphate/cardiolipin synthase-like enzyme